MSFGFPYNYVADACHTHKGAQQLTNARGTFFARHRFSDETFHEFFQREQKRLNGTRPFQSLLRREGEQFSPETRWGEYPPTMRDELTELIDWGTKSILDYEVWKNLLPALRLATLFIRHSAEFFYTVRYQCPTRHRSRSPSEWVIQPNDSPMISEVQDPSLAEFFKREMPRLAQRLHFFVTENTEDSEAVTETLCENYHQQRDRFPIIMSLDVTFLKYAHPKTFARVTTAAKNRFWVSLAIVLAHEMAHVMWFGQAYFENFRDEPFFGGDDPEELEGQGELGMAWENWMFGCRIESLGSTVVGDYGMVAQDWTIFMRDEHARRDAERPEVFDAIRSQWRHREPKFSVVPQSSIDALIDPRNWRPEILGKGCYVGPPLEITEMRTKTNCIEEDVLYQTAWGEVISALNSPSAPLSPQTTEFLFAPKTPNFLGRGILSQGQSAIFGSVSPPAWTPRSPFSTTPKSDSSTGERGVEAASLAHPQDSTTQDQHHQTAKRSSPENSSHRDIQASRTSATPPPAPLRRSSRIAALKSKSFPKAHSSRVSKRARRTVPSRRPGPLPLNNSTSRHDTAPATDAFRPASPSLIPHQYPLLPVSPPKHTDVHTIDRRRHMPAAPRPRPRQAAAPSSEGSGGGSNQGSANRPTLGVNKPLPPLPKPGSPRRHTAFKPKPRIAAAPANNRHRHGTPLPSSSSSPTLYPPREARKGSGAGANSVSNRATTAARRQQTQNRDQRSRYEEQWRAHQRGNAGRNFRERERERERGVRGSVRELLKRVFGNG
ncbi:MAG: hypothetical protein Q9227_007278 [Pyrenula ochraceoflavens]